MIDENCEIVKLKYMQRCYSGIDDRFYFEKDNARSTIMCASLFSTYKIPMVEINNYKEFNKGILSIIKNWKRKYYPKYDICDGLCWELNLKLSNGKYIYYSGQEEIPENYDDLLRFLEKYFK